MSSPHTRATELASLLAHALATTPHQDVSEHRIRIEAEVPDGLDETLRRTMLTSLNSTADRFGHELKDGRSIIWAELDRENPQ
ncbi:MULTISPECIES: hypothetical protein [unclassified Streptomyces]|uniref:hypothetical protein n=1 Tax=unclassified Streptomyces TaxID=2593676 RepID=UPI0023663C2A|nr:MULTISPECIES: hypothetical protein [unclassified Streptomyces]MDF3141812.1 hypothetical protein [Streptomyces sp. T21Q-yed]WDF45101.1 hypothetical protein PBV52_51290 [Streptomyces sp. T12]